MIEMTFDKLTERVAFNCWTESPAIYLDHWAMCDIARDPELKRQFFEIFASKGTLMFSQANIAEITGNDGEDVALIKSFLEDVGLKWFPLDFNALQVANKERQGIEGASANTEFLVRYAPTIGHGKLVLPESFTLGNVVNIVHDPEERKKLLQFFTAFKAELVGVLEGKRTYMKVNNITPRPKPTGSTGSPTEDIYYDLERMILTQSFKITGNHVMDYLHATVALRYADLLCLDQHWLEMVKGLRYPYNAKVFSKRSLASFFEAFRDFGNPVAEASPTPV